MRKLALVAVFAAVFVVPFAVAFAMDFVVPFVVPFLGLALAGPPSPWAGTEGPGAHGSSGATVEVEVEVETEILVPPAQRLDLAPSLLVWPVPTAENLAVGYLDAPETIVLTVHSNIPWELALRARDLRPAGAANEGETPRIEMLWRIAGGSFARVGGDWITAASGTGGTAGEEIRIQLRVPLTWANARPGSYEPRIEYRLSPLRP